MSTFQQGSEAQIQHTSRADLNGQLCRVGELVNGRYQCTVLATNKIISLKPEKLCTPSPFAKFMNNPLFRQYFNQAQTLLNQFNHTGYDPKLIIGGVILLFLALVYLFGFMRGGLILSVVFLTLSNGQSAYKNAGGGKNGAQAAANEVGTRLSRRIKSITGFSVPAKYTLFGAGVALFVLLRLTAPASTSSYAMPASTNAGSTNTGTDDLDEEDAAFFGISEKLYTWEDVENAYKVGFNDFQKKESLNEGIEDYTKNHKKRERRNVNDDTRRYSSAPPPMGGAGRHSGSARSSGSGFASMGNMFTLLILGNAVYSLGKTPAGGFDPQLIIPNAQLMPKWRLALNVMLVLRLFGMSPI
jgi:hypothetical protein